MKILAFHSQAGHYLSGTKTRVKPTPSLTLKGVFMSGDSVPTVSLVLSDNDKAAKQNAIIAYALMLSGFFFGLTWIIGGIWAMVKKSDAQGTLFEDHYSNAIKTFWIGLCLSIIGGLLVMVGIGVIILIATAIWTLYKLIKGLARITSNKSYANS
jgi:uncharacterized membrane protein